MAKILISEKQLERLSKKLIKEQWMPDFLKKEIVKEQQNRQRTVGPKEFVEMEMTNSLNDIIIDKQNEIASALKVSIVNQKNEGGSVAMKIGGDIKPFLVNEKMRRYTLPLGGEWSISVPANANVDLYEELYKIPKYKNFFDKKTELTEYVKREVQRAKIPFNFFPTQVNGGFNFAMSGKKKPKGVPLIEFDEPFSLTYLTPIGKGGGSGSNSIGIRLGRKVYGTIWGGDMQSNLTRLQLNVPLKLLPQQPDSDPIIPDTPEIVIAPEPFVINTKQNYLYDKPGLTPAAQKAIDTQIFEELFEEGGTRVKEYIDFLKDKTIVVRAFSSRDGDPDAIQNGAYKQCQVSGSKRSEYNQCLSEKRAQNVVDYLKTASNGILSDINFKSVGMGENCKSGNCWKPGKKNHTSKDTQFDRRFSVNFPRWDGKTN